MLACFGQAECRTTQRTIARDALVGSYVYKSEDPEFKATDHQWDHLTLLADGKYDLVQGGPTKAKSEIVGSWTVWSGGPNGPTILLDHAGYAIRVKRDEVRLLIDNDVGIWYAKAK